MSKPSARHPHLAWSWNYLLAVVVIAISPALIGDRQHLEPIRRRWAGGIGIAQSCVSYGNGDQD